MLQINFLRDNKQEVIERLKVKNFDSSSIIDEVITLDDNRKSTQQESDELLSRANLIAKEIGILFKEGKSTEANALKEESHHSHLSLSEALQLIEKINPEKAYLTHISHLLGFHDEFEKRLPENVFIAYDTLKITI